MNTKTKIMKKLLMLITLGLFLTPGILLAQDDEKLENPKNSRIKEYDEFKNNAFGIYSKSLKFKKMVDNGEKFTVEDVRSGQTTRRLKHDVGKDQGHGQKC